MGILWHRDWSKANPQEGKTGNLRGTNVEKTTCVLISTKTYDKKKVHSIFMKPKVFRAPLKSNQGCCLECFGTPWWRILCDQNIFVVTVFPCFLSTFSPSLQKILWLFLESCRYFSHPRQTFDLFGFQESNPTSWSEDLVCGTVWQQVRGGGSRAEQNRKCTRHIRCCFCFLCKHEKCFPLIKCH